jgi:hypothetical protein
LPASHVDPVDHDAARSRTHMASKDSVCPPEDVASHLGEGGLELGEPLEGRPGPRVLVVIEGHGAVRIEEAAASACGFGARVAEAVAGRAAEETCTQAQQTFKGGTRAIVVPDCR